MLLGDLPYEMLSGKHSTRGVIQIADDVASHANAFTGFYASLSQLDQVTDLKTICCHLQLQMFLIEYVVFYNIYRAL